MKWFLNLSTRAKIIFSFGSMFILLAIIIVTALTNIMSISDSQRELVQMNFKPALDLVEIRADLNRDRASIVEMVLTTDKTKQLVPPAQELAWLRSEYQSVLSAFARKPSVVPEAAGIEIAGAVAVPPMTTGEVAVTLTTFAAASAAVA